MNILYKVIINLPNRHNTVVQERTRTKTSPWEGTIMVSYPSIQKSYRLSQYILITEKSCKFRPVLHKLLSVWLYSNDFHKPCVPTKNEWPNVSGYLTLIYMIFTAQWSSISCVTPECKVFLANPSKQVLQIRVYYLTWMTCKYPWGLLFAFRDHLPSTKGPSLLLFNNITLLLFEEPL